MTSDYLSIARNFRATGPATTGPPDSIIPNSSSEISEISERRVVQDDMRPADDLADHALADEHEAIQALGVVEERPGDYDHKATLPNSVPPYERVLALQEWLASIDWRYGLRCGLSGQQCRHCKGIPCDGSTEWRQGGSTEKDVMRWDGPSA